MTDKSKFMDVVNNSGKKVYEVASALGMSHQTFYNKLANVSDFTAPEMVAFRKLFPDVTDEMFQEIFFAKELAVKPNE
jgi:uncharacterized protein (DUF2225 family)